MEEPESDYMSEGSLKVLLVIVGGLALLLLIGLLSSN